MLILLLSYFGGVLTILSPCVLPVIPFIFAKSEQPFRKSGLPMLIGMALCFASFAALSVVGGSYVIKANQMGRAIALLIFALVGLSLMFPNLATYFTQPLVKLGGTLQKKSNKKRGLGSSLVLGASLGLLWAPCAGPILGLVLAGAAFENSLEKTFGLLLVFAMGAATSLGLAIFAGGKVLRLMKKSFGIEEWLKRAIGVSVLVAAVAIFLGLDTKLLAKISFLNTGNIEQALLEKTSLVKQEKSKTSLLTDEGFAPPLEGAIQWLNSEPLDMVSLLGKVVLIDFWTYSCINCLRTLPYLKAWYERYHHEGLVIIGVHTPEFAFEKSIDNIKKAVADFHLPYPIAVDNNYKIWSSYQNQYWPAHYFIDVKGHVRHHQFGEGQYDESEKMIQFLLAEKNPKAYSMPKKLVEVKGQGILAAASDDDDDEDDDISPETYLGYHRQEGFVSIPSIKKDQEALYKMPKQISLNQWALAGSWKVGKELATLVTHPGRLTFRFRARDLHLVMGTTQGKAIDFVVTIDGKPPLHSYGQDIDAEGKGKVQAHRLYQLIRQQGPLNQSLLEHTFNIEFLDSEVEVFAFTFG